MTPFPPRPTAHLQLGLLPVHGASFAPERQGEEGCAPDYTIRFSLARRSQWGWLQCNSLAALSPPAEGLSCRSAASGQLQSLQKLSAHLVSTQGWGRPRDLGTAARTARTSCGRQAHQRPGLSEAPFIPGRITTKDRVTRRRASRNHYKTWFFHCVRVRKDTPGAGLGPLFKRTEVMARYRLEPDLQALGPRLDPSPGPGGLTPHQPPPLPHLGLP